MNKVVIFGVGLIGGSFALALKKAGAAGSIVGMDRSPAYLARALERGIIDVIGGAAATSAGAAAALSFDAAMAPAGGAKAPAAAAQSGT